MKTSLLFSFFILFFLSTSFAQSKDNILGKWISEHGSGKIEIFKEGEEFAGKLIWLKEPLNEEGKPKTDVHNPTEDLRSRPVMDLEILKNFTYKGDGEYTDGTVYDPKSGKTYNCKMTLKSKDKLEIRGFMGISLIGKSETWTRVE
ncbi:MAG: hypothetical protein JWN56_2886 [Sphingobacteriales bacterium]|nr:hypothetical protein [Sphingobacteriales bacterium]